MEAIAGDSPQELVRLHLESKKAPLGSHVITEPLDSAVAQNRRSSYFMGKHPSSLR